MKTTTTIDVNSATPRPEGVPECVWTDFLGALWTNRALGTTGAKSQTSVEGVIYYATATRFPAPEQHRYAVTVTTEKPTERKHNPGLAVTLLSSENTYLTYPTTGRLSVIEVGVTGRIIAAVFRVTDPIHSSGLSAPVEVRNPAFVYGLEATR